VDRCDYIYAASKFLFHESPAFDNLEKLQQFMDDNDLRQPRYTHSQIDGFYVSHAGGRHIHKKKMDELVSGDRLILDDFNKLPVHRELTDDNVRSKTIIFPVYDTMESDAKVNWYVRYRTPCSVVSMMGLGEPPKQEV